MIDSKMPGLYGAKIRELRTKRGISLRRLARLSNMSSSYLCQIELGQLMPPSWWRIAAISRALFADPVYLSAYANISRAAREIFEYEQNQ